MDLYSHGPYSTEWSGLDDGSLQGGGSGGSKASMDVFMDFDASRICYNRLRVVYLTLHRILELEITYPGPPVMNAEN